MSRTPSKASPAPDDTDVPPLRATRVTLRDIAQKLGVSHATVCLGLRDNPRISKARCLQIKETAQQLGYHPDPMLTALSHYRRCSSTQPVRSSIAWLSFWDNPEDMHAYAELHQYWLGAKEVAEKYGYRLEVFSPGPRYPLARVQRVLQTRNVSGVLVAPPQGNFKINLEDFDWSLFPVVKFGYSIAKLPVHVVTSAHVSNAILAYRRIKARGYRRIAFITSLSSIERTQFPCGFLRGQLDSPLQDRLPILGLADNQDVDQAALAKWIKLHRPDAILTNLSQTRRMLDALDIRVPEDIGLATFSIHDGLVDAGINQNPQEIGRAGAETVISLITHNTRGIPAFQREVLIEGSWVDGHSLPDLNIPRPQVGQRIVAVPAIG